MVWVVSSPVRWQIYFMVLTTPGIPGKLLEFWNFLLGPWKTLGKTDNFLVFLELENSWNFVEMVFYHFYKQTENCRSIWFMILLFVFYVDSISVAASVAQITLCRFFLPRENLGLSTRKINSYPGGKLLKWCCHQSVSTLCFAFFLFVFWECGILCSSFALLIRLTSQSFKHWPFNENCFKCRVPRL